MSATIIPLRRPRTEDDAPARPSDTEGASSGPDPVEAPASAQIATILAQSRAQRAKLLATIARMQVPAVRAYPELARVAAQIEATAVRTLAEVDLLMRRTEALAMWPPREV